MNVPVRERRRRRLHTNSRNGCTVCKYKHLKCDERRPICGHCIRRKFGSLCKYLPADGGSTTNATQPDKVDPELSLNHVGTPVSWSRSENHLMFSTLQILKITSAADTGLWGNVLSLGQLLHWATLSFEYECLRHAVIAAFAPAFPATLGASMCGRAVEHHIAIAVSELRKELSQPSSDRLEGIAAASSCIQMVFGLNGKAKEWTILAAGSALVRRAMKDVKNHRIVGTDDSDAEKSNNTTQMSSGKRGGIWKPDPTYERSLQEHDMVTAALLDALERLKYYVNDRRGRRGTVAHMIACVRVCRTMPIPTTPEQQLWIWNKHDIGMDSFPAQCSAILSIEPLDMLLACIHESIPIVFYNIFFPDKKLVHAILAFKENTIRLIDELRRLPPEGDIATGCDRSTILGLAHASYHAASTFPLVPDTPDEDLRPQWPQLDDDMRVFEVEEDDSNSSSVPDSPSPFLVKIKSEPVDGVVANYVKDMSEPYPFAP